MALHLAARQDHRSLVVLVEKWATIDEPSPAARIAVARSFVELRLLDRAWVRLKDLVEADEAPIEALALAGRMFLLRGWPNQARKLVQRGLEHAPRSKELEELWKRCSDVATEPDESAAEGEGASIAELLGLAEHFMAQGSFLRARGLLERIRRCDPEHDRADDLLWAIDGDFSSDLPLDALCENLGPDLATLSELGDEAEHTESADLDHLPLQIDRDDDGGFPLLFRNLEPHTDPAERTDTEVTSVASMSELSETSFPTDPSEHTDPHGDDTEIMRIVRKKPAPDAAGTDSPDASFNLADFRREMGVEGPNLDTDYTAGAEDEDDSVVIVTRREEATQRDASTDVGGIKLDTLSEKEASLKQGTLEETRWAAPASEDPTDRVPAGNKPRKRDTPASTGEDSPPPPKRPPSRPKSKARTPSLPEPGQVVLAWPWWMAVLAVLLASGVVVFAVIALVAAL